MSDNETAKILNQNILDAQHHLISQHPFLTYRKGLDKFAWTEGDALEAIKFYLAEFQANMQLPVLYLWGKQGTGKTHLAGALSAYLILNYWTRGEPGKHIRISSFAYVDWGLFMQAELEKKPIEVDWAADLLVFEGLDNQPPIPRSGDTFRVDQAFLKLSQRLEILKLPTIITARHPLVDLQGYLMLNIQGEHIEHSRESAENFCGLIAGAALARGQTGTTSFKTSAIKNPDFIRQAQQMLEKQNNLWPETNRAGLPTLF